MSAPDLVDVTGVRVLSRYVLELTFNDGARRVVDVESYLWGPAFEEVRSDYEFFLAVTADPESGTIVWPNGADLAPDMLYEHSKPAVPA